MTAAEALALLDLSPPFTEAELRVAYEQELEMWRAERFPEAVLRARAEERTQRAHVAYELLLGMATPEAPVSPVWTPLSRESAPMMEVPDEPAAPVLKEEPGEAGDAGAPGAAVPAPGVGAAPAPVPLRFAHTVGGGSVPRESAPAPVPVPLPLPLSPSKVEGGDGAAREEGLPVPLPEPVSGSVPLGVTPPRTPPSVSAPGSPGDAEAEAVPRKLLPSPKIPVVVVNRSGTWPPPQQPQPPPPPPQVPFTGTYPVIPPEDGSLASLMERVARESAVPAERGMVDLGGGSGVEYPFSPTQPGSLTPSPLLPRSGAADANADAAAAPQTPAPPVEDVTNPWAWLALLGSGIFAFSALMDLASWHSQSALVWVPVLLSLLVIAVVAWGWGKRHGDSGQVMTIFGVVLGGIGALCYLASSMDDSGRPARPQSELAKSDFAKVQASGDVEAMKELARDGDAEAQMELWRLFENGRVKPAHDAERIEWMRDAAEQGHAGAQCALAEAYERGDSALIPKDEVTAATWFQAAANRGSPRAQGKLGGYYALGRGGLTQSGNLALRYWRQGAEKDDPLALYELGHAYETGYVAPVAMAEAVRFYQKAAERGQAEAMVRLAICYSEGKGVEKDERAFRRWINEAIDRGSREAMYQKGWAHEYGEGFPPE